LTREHAYDSAGASTRAAEYGARLYGRKVPSFDDGGGRDDRERIELAPINVVDIGRGSCRFSGSTHRGIHA
jgi:hypothetical protein